jgi:ribosomal protein S18 acetylase RimI-like enzyme
MRKKKNQAVIGTVLHKIKDPNSLKPWAEYLATIDPWKTLEITSQRLFDRWVAESSTYQFFAAVDPREKVREGFEREDGLIVFTVNGAKAIIERIMNKPLAPELATVEDGGYVGIVGTKARRKGVGKYLLAAAERVVQEGYTKLPGCENKYPTVFLFVSAFNQSAQRFYKSQGYEEVAQAQDCIKPGNTELLMIKRLHP